MVAEPDEIPTGGDEMVTTPKVVGLLLVAAEVTSLVTTRVPLMGSPARFGVPGVVRRSRVTATATMGLKDTLGSIFVPPPPPPPATVIEGAANFRMLGVPPTAEYDEVQAAVTSLKAKYAGDTKKLLQIDVAKDKISELRLRQRVSGTLGVTSEVASRDRQLANYENQAMNRAVSKATPKFIKKIPYMYKPFWNIKNLKNSKDREFAKAHVKMAGLYWLGFATGGLFFPGGINYLKFGAPLIFVSHLAQRGQPPVVKDAQGMAGAVRDPIYHDYVWAGLFLIAHSVAALVLSNFVVPWMDLIRPKQTRFLLVTGAMALADTIWQPHMEK